MITILSAQLPTVMNIFEEGKQRTFFINDQIPFIETQVTLNIPTPRSILNALPLITTPDQIEGIVKNFEKLKKQCQVVENQIQTLINQIDKILFKINRVESIFTTVDGFINFISDFVPLLRTLTGTAQVALAAQVFPIASGIVTIRLGDAIRYAKSKLKEIDALVKVTAPISEFASREAGELRSTLYPVREKLQEILTKIRARRFYIDSVLISKLKELSLSTAQNPPTGGGIDGPNGTGVLQDSETIVNMLGSQFEPEDILNNLENSNKSKFIEYLVENGFTGYQIVKK